MERRGPNCHSAAGHGKGRGKASGSVYSRPGMWPAVRRSTVMPSIAVIMGFALWMRPRRALHCSSTIHNSGRHIEHRTLSPLGHHDHHGIQHTLVALHVLSPRLCCASIHHLPTARQICRVRPHPIIQECKFDPLCDSGVRGYRGLISTGSMFSDLVPWSIPWISPGRNMKWVNKHSGKAYSHNTCWEELKSPLAFQKYGDIHADVSRWTLFSPNRTNAVWQVAVWPAKQSVVINVADPQALKVSYRYLLFSLTSTPYPIHTASLSHLTRITQLEIDPEISDNNS